MLMVGENKPVDNSFMIWPPTRQDMRTIWVVSLSRHVPTNFQCYAALKDGINVFPCISPCISHESGSCGQDHPRRSWVCNMLPVLLTMSSIQFEQNPLYYIGFVGQHLPNLRMSKVRSRVDTNNYVYSI